MNPAQLPGGLLVAIEGIDGAGKTTLADSLRQCLSDGGQLPVVLSKEPTQGPHGQALRATALTGRLAPADELALLVADRRQHVAELIAPALQAGKVVILDRYYYSNIAYQGAEGLPPEQVIDANAFAPRPDLVLLLDLPVAQGLSRIAARGDAANRFETADNLRRVAALFAAHLPPAPVGAVVDASQSADAVLRKALQHVLLTIAHKAAAAYGPGAEAAEFLSHALPRMHAAEVAAA